MAATHTASWIALCTLTASFAGCLVPTSAPGPTVTVTSTPTGTSGPTGATGKGGEDMTNAVRGDDVLAIGEPDGPSSTDPPSPPTFAAPARDFEPNEYEPPVVLRDPGDKPNPDWPIINKPTRPDGDPPWHFDPSIALPDGPCPRPPLDPASFALFDEAAQTVLADGSGFAANLAVSDQCGLLYEKGYGILGPRPWAPTWTSPLDFQAYINHIVEPTNPDTIWRIASLTKPITSAVIHLMVEDGLIDYDDTVFCPNSSDTTSGFGPPGSKCLLNYDPATGDGCVWDTVTVMKQTITVEHLLQHNGGWDRDGSQNGDFMFMPDTVNTAVGGTLPPDEADIVRWALCQSLSFGPGNQAVAIDAYSNFGFMLLSLIIDKWGDKNHLEYLEQDILGPLGVPAGDIGIARSLPEDFNAREPYYPCGGTKGTTPFPGQTDEPVCWMYGGMVMEPQFGHGSLLTTADAIARFMSKYWVDSFFDENKGQPRNSYMTFPDDERGYHNGIYPGVKSIMLQCLNGLNFAFLMNSAQSPDWGDATTAFCDAGDDFYDAGPFFASVWIPDEDKGWAHRHLRTGAEHQEQFDTLSSAGYRLEDVACYDLGGTAYYTSAWVHDPTGPDWVAVHGATQAQFQDAMDDFDADGFRGVELSACNVGGQILWNGVWISEPGGPDWVAHPGLSHSAYQDQFEELVADGYRPVDVTAYDEGGVAKYAALYVRAVAPAEGCGRAACVLAPPVGWAAIHGANLEELLDAAVDNANNQRYYSELSIVEVAGTRYYAAIFTTDVDGVPTSFKDTPLWDMEQVIEDQDGYGWRMISVDAT